MTSSVCSMTHNPYSDQENAYLRKKEKLKKISVSIIIPYYNGSKWIERALISAFHQSIPAVEIIVVNDGSKQDEKEFLHSLKNKFNFILIDKENGGQGSARNEGVRQSKCDYICFLDQDDFYLFEHIELLLMGLPEHENKSFGYVYGDCKEADGDGNIIRGSMVKEHSVHPKNNIFDLIRNDMFILPSAALIKRDVFLEVDGFDEQFTGYEDDDLFMRIFRKGYEHIFVDKPVYVWCINDESTSYSIRMSRSRFKYFMKLKSEFPDDPNKARYPLRDLIVPRFGRSFIHDVIKASKYDKEKMKEVIGILESYLFAIKKNKYISKAYKLRIYTLIIFFRFSPLFLIKLMRKVSHLPVIRKRFSSFVS